MSTHSTDNPLPKWLQVHTEEVIHAIENKLDHDPRLPRTKAERELREHNLECLFVRAIPMIAEGKTFKHILALEDHPFTTGEVMQWIRADAKRSARYNEARKIGAEVIEDEMIAIADGDGMEDVQRSTLRINTRKWVLEKNNKERYGQDSQPSNPFAGGVTIVIGDVQPKQLEHNGNTYDG